MNHLGFVRFAASLVMALLMASTGSAQQTSATAVNATPVPHLVSYSGTLKDSSGKPVTGITGVTFSLYRDAEGGAPVWMETQNVKPDSTGRYTAQLGATRSEGLPPETFMTGEARWLAVQAAGAPEQPRVLLVAVPYAMKAADAETIGGLPPSAFMLAVPPRNGASGTNVDASSSNPVPGAPPPASTVTTTGGTLNALPLWTTATNVQSSAITQTGSGATAKIGIGTTAPAGVLDVKGSAYVRGALTLPAIGNSTATAGKNSQPQDFIASSFNSVISTAVNQKFQWQAEPAANDTANPSGTLNLLYGLGATPPAETGLKLNGNGQITFAAGQTFPGTATGTVKSVGLSAPSSDFTVSGSPVTGSGTLSLKWNTAPTSANTPNAIVKRDANGSFSTGPISVLSTVYGSAALTVANPGTSGYGVNASGTSYGVVASGNTGVWGGGDSYGVDAESGGTALVANGGDYGVYATGSNASGGQTIGVLGGGTTGVYGTGSTAGVAAYSDTGQAVAAETDTDDTNDTLVTINNGGGFPFYAGGTGGGVYISANGDLVATGSISGSSKNFRVDHPLDPENKYLYHASVESSEMMNIYTGNVTTDGQGLATVQLPDWFEAVNTDFRYQLTVIGQFAQAIVNSEVANLRFSIKTDKPNVKVSWQITGVRQDAYAKSHPLVVEQEKPASERGLYVHPELYGAPGEKAVDWAHHPNRMKPPNPPQASLPTRAARTGPAKPITPAVP